ncbi:MAG: OmpA family protein [Candidatus Kapaibacterium sp.]
MLWGQAPRGDLRDVFVVENKDTLVITREYGDYWFGFGGGVNLNMYLGNLQLPLDPYLPANDTINPLVDFPIGWGGGYNISLFAEYLPKEELFGYGLRVHFIDYRSANIETDPLGDSVNSVLESETLLDYFTISPYFRYNFPLEGLHFFGGLDIELSTSAEARLSRKFEHTGDINQISRFDFRDINTRLGLNAGIGWDFFIMDVSRRLRVHFAPYFSVHAGTSILSDFGSSWNTIYARAGVSIKLGPDEIGVDTLEYDPDYSPPPEYLASVQSDRGVEAFAVSAEPIVSAEIAYVELPKVLNEVMETPMVNYTARETARSQPERQREREQIVTGRPRTFNYPTSSYTGTFGELENYLDDLAAFLQQNPGVTVRVVGHSDNQGTPQQNQNRARARADEVHRYLISKGVAARRVFPDSRGDRVPVGDNRTEAGRKKNRRVEIVVIQ